MSDKIRALIVDDEPLAREGLRMAVEPDSDFTIIGEAANGHEAVELITREHPELVFLDIQMPEMSGFDVLKALPSGKLPMIVFVTAYDSYAIRAFEVHAVDYVLKPLDPARFQMTLDRIKSDLKLKRDSQIGDRLAALLDALRRDEIKIDNESYLSRFVLKEGDRIYFVNADDVDWIEAADYYAQLHTGKKTHLIRETLNRLETQLDPSKFTRIHRSTIVNTSRIKELKRHFQSEFIVILDDGTHLKMSRSYRDNLASFLGEKE
ncbi:MAG: LytTR family transcriptional regulator DNA-binding domain-containing protein [candidate division Zixibacteria bacterium]|nr:LytTR family transcriptional regulator DNA-binding domain-containing protein [candidate division Zixibacteria bacterium]